MARPAEKKRRGRNLYFKRGSWWFAKQIENKREWVNLRTADEAAAIKLREQIEHSPLLRPGDTITEHVEEFVAHKKAKRAFSRNSSHTKVLILRRFARWLPETTKLAGVTSRQCEEFYSLLQDEVEDSTAESYMMTLRSFFRWAVEVKRVRVDNPVAKVELLTFERRGREKFCEKDAANALIASAPDDDLRFVLFCGFHAGLRKDEIIEARRHWFDLRGGSLNVFRAVGRHRLQDSEREWRPKYNKERTVPLTQPFREFLAGYLRGRDDPLDFVLQPGVKHGKARYRYDFRRPFTDFMWTAAHPWLTPHVMRHSFASNLKIAGKSIAKIADWLGDTERVTEKNYAHLRPDDRDVQALA